MPRSFVPALALVALPLSAPLAAQTAEPASAERTRPRAPGAQLTSGIEHKSGTYGTGQRLATTAIATGLQVSSGQFQLSATVPYVRVEGPGNIVGGGGLLGLPIIVDPTRPSTRSRREGIGDTRLAANYTLPTRSVGLGFSGEVKLPTASPSKGLGTGATDFALGAEVSKSLGPVTPFVGVTYTLAGDPDGFELRNTLSGRAGAAIQMSQNLRGHLAYGHAQSASAELEAERQISTGFAANVSEALSLGFYGSAGLSRSAADVGAGIQLGFRIR